jgi:hypothetical protein
MDVPEVRYAWNGDVALAYQVIGDGPVDIVKGVPDRWRLYRVVG